MKILPVLIIIFVAEFCSGTFNSDTFSEELLLKPLYNDKLYAHFQFTTRWNVNPESDELHHTHLFPRAISEIIIRHKVQELHLSLTAGLWRYETWGYPVKDAAPGAEVWAWFSPDTEDVDKNWRELANSLSGLICASINFVDDSTSVSPQISLRPAGVIKSQFANSSFLRYASLPREIVCTENLTPWKKLLPCDSKIGLASLLNAGYIHNTRYHSIALDLRPICRGTKCETTSLELQQSVSLVYDYAILGNRDWSLRRLFGQGILGNCPLADSSNVYVDVTSNGSVPFQLNPAPDAFVTSVRGGFESVFAKYSVKPYAMSISATHSGREMVSVTSPPPIYASQYKTGYGQQKGGIVTKVYNNYWTPLEVVVFQNIPWYVPIYLHTLKIKSGDLQLEPETIKFSPGRLREKPYCLEIVLTLPARSTTSLSVNFDFVFLKWQEYPPDANHGFYIGSAVVSAVLPLARNFTGFPQNGGTIAESFNASRSGYLVQVRTESMVITLPTPDFSMPYNVICLACTVVALAFGPLHNITTKRLKLRIKSKGNFFGKIKSKVFCVFKGGKCDSDSGEGVEITAIENEGVQSERKDELQSGRRDELQSERKSEVVTGKKSEVQTGKKNEDKTETKNLDKTEKRM